jgi:hypothetical protein
MLEVNRDCKEAIVGKRNRSISVPNEPSRFYLTFLGHLLNGLRDDGKPIPGDEPKNHRGGQKGEDELDHQDPAKR